MSERVRLEGITLNTRVDGPEGAPWIVLSNSLGTTLEMWDRQIPFLTQRYRVLRYDTRGHGGSDTPAAPFGFDDLTGDVVALMDHHGIDRAMFMGLSLGGMTGLGLAIHHADRFDGVICADGRADAPPPFVAMWDDRMGKVREGGLAAILEPTLGTWLTEDWRNAHPSDTDEIRKMVLSNDPEGYIGCCKALQKLDYLKDLGNAGVPVLFVGGEKDMGAAPAVMSEMAAATPGGRYIEIADAAHIANINQPEAFNAAIADFLKLPEPVGG